ncbi:hypothetical protein AD998_10925 [bacterium 336/3]|nr:hypothetical protein AD998_10925 [bacterium 336/3]
MKNIIIIAFCIVANFSNAQNLIPEQNKKGLFGYKKTNSKDWIIKPTFQQAKKFGESGLDTSFALAKQKNLWGIINKKGEWALKPTYDDFNKIVHLKEMKSIIFYNYNPFYADLFLVENQKIIETPLKKCKYLDIFEQYDVYIFKERNDEFYFFKPDKQIIGGYDTYFNGGNFAIGKKNGRYEWIDLEMLTIHPIGAFDNFKYIVNDILITQNGKKGILSDQDNIQIPIEYDEITLENKSDEEGNEDIFFVTKNNLKGIFLKDSSVYSALLKTEYSKIEKISPNSSIYFLEKNGKKGLFSMKNKRMLLTPDYENIQILECKNFNQFLCFTTKDNKKELYDVNRQKVIASDIDSVFCLSVDWKKELIILQKDKKYAVLKNVIDGKTTDFFDKINIEKPKKRRQDGPKYYRNEVVVYKTGMKQYMNPETFLYSSKPFSIIDEIGSPEEPIELIDQVKAWYEEYEVKELAQYEGGMIAFRKAIQDKLIYPQNMRERHIEGKVVLQFIINEQGYMLYVKTLRDIGYDSGKAAEAALKRMNEVKRWTPAKNAYGQPVRVRKTIIVRFKL